MSLIFFWLCSLVNSLCPVFQLWSLPYTFGLYQAMATISMGSEGMKTISVKLEMHSLGSLVDVVLLLC